MYTRTYWKMKYHKIWNDLLQIQGLILTSNICHVPPILMIYRKKELICIQFQNEMRHSMSRNPPWHMLSRLRAVEPSHISILPVHEIQVWSLYVNIHIRAPSKIGSSAPNIGVKNCKSAVSESSAHKKTFSISGTKMNTDENDNLQNSWCVVSSRLYFLTLFD